MRSRRAISLKAAGTSTARAAEDALPGDCGGGSPEIRRKNFCVFQGKANIEWWKSTATLYPPMPMSSYELVRAAAGATRSKEIRRACGGT